MLLPALGIHITAGGRAQPCPVCGGKDRFRFDNLQGRGTWFCNQCGSGDGLNLVEKALAVTAKEAAVKVAGVLGEPSGNTLLEHNPQQEQQDKALARNNAAQQARQLLASARQQAGNAYLTAKGWPDTDALTLQGPSLRVGGITYQSGDLLVPLTDSTGDVVNVQLINAAGVKRTLAGGQVKNTCHFLPGQDNAVIWLTEGYATGLTVHQLTGESVCVALSANNLPAMAQQLRTHYPDALLLLAADNDENGTGQARAAEAAQLSGGKPALPSETGDWNDVYQQQGKLAALAQLAAFSQPKQPSPFDTLSDADLKAMSASEKAELLAEHYQHLLAVPPVGEDLCRYENGAWQVLPYRVLSREIAALFQKVRAPFSAAGINSILDTLKLMVPQMGTPARHLIGFRNGVFDTTTGQFSPHQKTHWLRTVNSVDYTPPKAGENLADHAPHFWRWLTRAAGQQPDKQARILAALFMVLANRYDWQLFLEVTGPGGSGKSVMAAIARLLAGADNTTSATIDNLESARERASVVGFSLIILPDQEKWSGDGAGIKAITGGDAVAIDPKYRDAYAAHIPAVILAVNNNPMQFSDRSGGISRRRVILPFPEVIPANERDSQLLVKITGELAVIVRHLMQRFAVPNDARVLLEAQQNSDEALEIKRSADPLVDFCGYLLAVSAPDGLYIGNANITPANPRKYLYHAYLSYMEARGHKYPLNLTAFGRAVPQTLREYGIALLKRKTNQGMQTNLILSEDCEADWLPKCEMR
ncbi:TPA: primase-helicase zinc-binding domain-containing protein [Serratia marcescens]|uniref:Primase-helicase zinc-binding domain-containing protein n=1 Tax=Serratia nevei TaxID=2703794 RepID=A0AAW6X499_9GAMM|nr:MULTISPECIES: primase-helicase zinc-binding domain-containing protein [Serratia]MDK4765529.1 primase-helicase zinc-binding domain-containing protein [Serratia nevei]MDK4771547.1 primase-helicase zinc-binding domain-containing protein [Serratia nevei]MDK4797673.1 primase-helicase zinc-binding domain-containing protein [Serratia nevei]MDK4802561.1 primase-helicase zinc-binding domain-containing protein [Serratia nevei]MDK4861180.1 primase-helicase zinc-binding domain-containing protein [Serra